MSTKKVLGCIIISMMPAGVVHAASVNAGAFVSGRIPTSDGGSEYIDEYRQDFVYPRRDGTYLASAAVSVAQAGAILTSEGAADFESGEMSTETAKTSPLDASSSANGYAGMGDYLIVTGAGPVEFLLTLSGSWDISELPVNDYGMLDVGGTISLGSGTAVETVLEEFRIFEPTYRIDPNGAFDETVTLRADLLEGLSYGLDASVFGGLYGGAVGGIVEVSGRLSMLAGQGAIFSFSDPNFLSTGPVTPVPVPAASLMLMAAIAGLFGLKRRGLRPSVSL